MANKSYASSEIGGDEDQVADPETSKDFNSAYSKVYIPIAININVLYM